jgi:hypothetical protein
MPRLLLGVFTPVVQTRSFKFQTETGHAQGMPSLYRWVFALQLPIFRKSSPVVEGIARLVVL